MSGAMKQIERFAQGLYDRREGKAIEDNPYSLPSERAAWEHGWVTEQRFIEKNPQLSTINNKPRPNP